MPDTEGQETAPLPANEIINIIYHSMRTTWKIKMIEQGFNHADSNIKEMIDFFESRVENFKPKEDKKNLQQLPRNPLKNLKERKREDFDSSGVECSKESTEALRPSKKNFMLHGKCRYSEDNSKDLLARSTSTNKKKTNLRSYRKSNNELIEKKFQKFVKNKKRRKTEKELQQITDYESKEIVSSLAESVEN